MAIKIFKYVEFDELGGKFAKCMHCGQIVAERTYREITIRSAPSRKEKVLVVQRLGNWTQLRVALSDGSYMEPIVCKSCANSLVVDRDVDSDIVDDLMEKAATGNRDQALFAGKGSREANAIYNGMKKIKVLKKISRDRTVKESHVEAVGLAKKFKKRS